MTVVAKTLSPVAAIPVAQTTQYTTPANTRAIIDKMTATNTTATAITLTAYLVTNGGTAGAGNKVISSQSIAPNTAYLCPEVVGHILNSGDFIVTEASATGLVGRISGREVT